MKGYLVLMTCLLLLLAIAIVATDANAAPVPLWGQWQQTFKATETTTPQTKLKVELTGPDGKPRTILGYWNGEQTWGVRFMPDQAGTWRYRTNSAPIIAGLHQQQGTFTCQRTGTTTS